MTPFDGAAWDVTPFSDAQQDDLQTSKASRAVQPDRYKTSLCNKFCSTGFCPYEERCMFAHGREELRTSEDNLRDGLVTEDAIRAFRVHTNYVRRQLYYAQQEASYPPPPPFDFTLPPPPQYEDVSDIETSKPTGEYRNNPYVNVLEESFFPEEYFSFGYESTSTFVPNTAAHAVDAISKEVDSYYALDDQECGVMEP